MHKLTCVSLSIAAALVFCFAGQAQAGWSAPVASSIALEPSLPVISIKDNKKHHGDHKGKNQQAKNKKHKDDDNDNEQTNESSKGNGTTPGKSNPSSNENVLWGDYFQQ